MKKLLISILSFVLIAFASIGGGLLLSGCGSSYSESTGGGELVIMIWWQIFLEMR